MRDFVFIILLLVSQAALFAHAYKLDRKNHMSYNEINL